MRNSFVFYGSYFEAINELPDEEQGQIYKAIIQYGILGEEPQQLSTVGKMCFKLIKPTLDASINRYDVVVNNGKKGGAPKGNKNASKNEQKQAEIEIQNNQKQPKNNQKQPKNNQKQPKNNQKQPKNNLNYNDNDNVNYNDNINDNENYNVNENVNYNENCNDNDNLNENVNLNGNVNVNDNVDYKVNDNENLDVCTNEPEYIESTCKADNSTTNADYVGVHTQKATTKKFVKPTVLQVRQYCQERGNAVDAQRFCDFYESKGWKVGNTPMKDWQACVRTWERDDANRSNKSPPCDNKQSKSASSGAGSNVFLDALQGL